MSGASGSEKTSTDVEHAWAGMETRLSEVRNDSNKDCVWMYTDWDDAYEQDMATLGFEGPKNGVKKLTALPLEKEARILDFGCGTGLVAELLLEQGYKNLYGVDPTESFISKCVEKKLYREAKVLEIDPATKIPYDDNVFDAVVSVGVFGPAGHGATQEAFEEVNRVLRPGGYFVNMIREMSYSQLEFGLDLKGGYARFETDGRWCRLPDMPCVYYSIKPLKGLVVTVQKKSLE